MKRFIEGEDRSQSGLFPERLEDYIAEDNPVRAIEVFIDEFDLGQLGFDGMQPEATGRRAYHPATLLKIYIYGYLNRIQSSRRLERETRRNVEMIWLTGRLMPDGEVKVPKLPRADAVAASSAFSPVLSPAQIAVEHGTYGPRAGEPLHEDAYLLKPVLSDGGMYDNLGLETVWKRYDTILVSDGGLRTSADGDPVFNWLSHSARVLEVIDNLVRSLRKRQLIHAYQVRERTGTYWGISSHIADYALQNPFPCPPARVLELAAIPTRLAPMSEDYEERLINWGYAICDTAMRTWVDPNAPPPAGYPYPACGV